MKDRHFTRFPLVIAGLTLALIASLVWNLYSSSPLPLTMNDAWRVLLGLSDGSMSQTVIETVRLPRSLMALMVGACLAVSGVVMQSFTQNPLASPALFGINSGAALAVALVSTVLSFSTGYSISFAAIVGGGIAWFLVMFLGGGFSSTPQVGRIVLAGIAVSAFCAAMTKACVILVEDQASSVLVWLAGTFASVDWNDVYYSAPILIIGLGLVALLGKQLNLLSLGDERAQTLGIDLTKFKLLLSFIVLMMVGVSVSTVGAIAFVGLVVPHIARLVIGHDHRQMVPVAMLIGATLTLVSDGISRMIIFPTETPAGAVLAIIGAPFFLILAVKKT